MIRTFASATLLALLLAACGQADQPPAPGDPATVAPRPPATSSSLDVGPPDDRVNDGYPDITPASTTPEAERSETGARSVLLAFARGIELKEFDQAWELMSPGDKARWTRAAFAAQFADLDQITVAAPSGTMEGAAGSSFYTAPLTITATDADGRPVRYQGEVVLRRVNDVPGASAADVRWHIASVSLDWTH